MHKIRIKYQFKWKKGSDVQLDLEMKPITTNTIQKDWDEQEKGKNKEACKQSKKL